MKRFDLPVYLPDAVCGVFAGALVFYRRARYGDGYRLIRLSQGQVAKVDADDYARLMEHKWCAIRYETGYYATRMAKVKPGRGGQRMVRMHREILGVDADKCVDHINGDGLDNRKANLRAASRLENSWNKGKQRGSYSSRYKGVTWIKRSCKWQARISCKGKSKFIGYFDDEEAAARAYDAKAKELFGEFARPNFG